MLSEPSMHVQKSRHVLWAQFALLWGRAACPALEQSELSMRIPAHMLWSQSMRARLNLLRGLLGMEGHLPISSKQWSEFCMCKLCTCTALLWSQLSWKTQDSWLQRCTVHVEKFTHAQCKEWWAGVPHLVMWTLASPLLCGYISA